MKTRRMGLTGNANYIFDNRYYVDLSYRMDGSSTFGSKKKYAQFWSSGIGWNIHNEKFFSNDVVNTLRLRLLTGKPERSKVLPAGLLRFTSILRITVTCIGPGLFCKVGEILT